jgi:hypothetical protein
VPSQQATNARFADFDRQVDRAVQLSLLEADTKHHSPLDRDKQAFPVRPIRQRPDSIRFQLADRILGRKHAMTAPAWVAVTYTRFEA